MNRVAIDIHIPDEAWEKTGDCGGDEDHEDPNARLLVAIHINGVPHHVEAFAVEEADGIQKPHPDFEYEYEGMCQMSQPDGSYQTVSINERDYVLSMSPYC
jgi:hypothetical protein